MINGLRLLAILIAAVQVSVGHATILLSDSPIAVRGEQSGLMHPEGISFSPSGNMFAIANLFENRISGYRLDLLDQILLISRGIEGPHDLSFSPDGSCLAIANRHGNSITIHGKAKHGGLYSRLIARISHGLDSPDSVQYSPVDKIIAVANTNRHAILLFRYEGEHYEKIPYQIIQNSRDIMKTPDGVAFSKDGELLAVTSHGNHSVLIYQRLSNGFYTSEPVEIIRGEETQLHYPHSLCFHPIDDSLAISNSGGTKTVNIFKKVSDRFPRYATVPHQTLEIYNPKTVHLQEIYPGEGGVKGIAFSPDGSLIGLCASDIGDAECAILIYRVTCFLESQ